MNAARRMTLGSILAVVMWGCLAGEGTGAAPPGPCGPTVDPFASLACDVQPIFSASCALSNCHAGGNPQAGQNLSAGLAFSNIVNVFSSQVPRLRRVEPGNPDSSYLVLKIEGDAGAVGGMATRMPLGLPPLDPAEIDTIRSWIARGAMNN